MLIQVPQELSVFSFPSGRSDLGRQLDPPLHPTLL